MREQVIWYLATANEDDHAVRALVKRREFAKAAFHCQQMAEKAFKALERWHHLEIPEEVRQKAQHLDRFYLRFRHAQGHPDGSHDRWTLEIIEELHDCARTIMRFAEDHLEEEIALASDVGI